MSTTTRRRPLERSAPIRAHRHGRSDPRIAARRVAVARDAGRHRLYVLVALGAAVALLIAGFAAIHSSLFAARQITISGASETSRATVLRTAGLTPAPPLIDVNDTKVATALEQLPWVLHARVEKRWPDGLSIAVTERVAVAEASLGHGRVALFDRSGRVLAERDKTVPGLVPVHLTGMIPRSGRAVAPVNQSLFALASLVPNALVARISMLEREANLGLIIDLTSGPRVVIGTSSDLQEKLVSLATLVAHVPLDTVREIDLAVPSAPVLTP